MVAFLPALRPENYTSHPLHGMERSWPETNCHVDVWIEVLSALGFNPCAALGFTVAQDFEGDQFTFFKVPHEDLAILFGIDVQELTIYDQLVPHVREQLRRRRLPLVEVDSFYLPDTQGVSYGKEHVKTLIGINRIDIAERALEYFHGEGYFRLAAADFDGVFGLDQTPSKPGGSSRLPPYVEFAKLGKAPPQDLAGLAVDRLRHHMARRPGMNPFVAFREALPHQLKGLTKRSSTDFHKYAFNTSRQFGANFHLLSDHLDWIAVHTGVRAARAILAADAISETAKMLQFQMARAAARRDAASLETGRLEVLVEAYETLFEDLDGTFGAATGSAIARDRAAGSYMQGISQGAGIAARPS